MPQTDAILPLLHHAGVAGSTADHEFIQRNESIYSRIAAETPQWLGSLHSAVQAGDIELTAGALGALKALALSLSGAGDAAWRLLHPLGDAALRRYRLAARVHNLVGLLRLMVAQAPVVLPDVRLVDALCDDDDDHGWRSLPDRLERLPGAVLASAHRALRRQPADFSDDDIGLRAELRQVFDWAQAERAEAGVFAVRCGWPRLALLARDWMDVHPGFGIASALPLRVRARHLEAVQLRSPAELERESLLMDNCLDSDDMAADLRRPDRAFFSIRDRTLRGTVADLELAYWPRSRRWAILQLKGPGNTDAEPDVRAFARALCGSFSPRLTLRFPKALPADTAHWADDHPDPRSARLAARFGMLLSTADIHWLAPFITRASRYRGAQFADTCGDALLAAWRKEFCARADRSRRAGDRSPRLRCVRLPSDAQNRPVCAFDFGQGGRAIAFRADGDGRLGSAVEVLDPARVTQWLDAGTGGNDSGPRASAPLQPA